MIRDVDPLDRLRAFVAKHPSQTAAAKALGVSRQFLVMMLGRKEPVSKRILAQLGLRWAIVADTRRRKTDQAEELAS